MKKETIKQAVKELKDERETARLKLNKVNQTLTTMQQICGINGHDLKEVGHDSHKTHYECQCCGFTEVF